jgi:transposase
VLGDHRIAAKQCLLTTRAAKWATVQVGTGRTVSEVAAELDCDWHTVNDAVTTYGQALLAADRKRLNRTAAIGLGETSFVRLADHSTSYATTVCDVEHRQIIDILPSRHFVEVAGFLDKQPTTWKQRIAFGALDMSATYAAVYTVILPKAAQVVDSFHVISVANRAWTRSGAGCRTSRPATAAVATTRSTAPVECCWPARNASPTKRRSG